MSMSRVLVRLALMLLAVHHTSQRDARAAEKEDPVPPLGSAEKERDCNNLQADVIFILDVSETMTQTLKCTELFFGGHECKNVTQANSDNFDTARIFIINLMYLTKDFVSPDFVRFGVVAFSYGGTAHSYLELSDKFYSDDVLKRIRNLPPAPSMTSAQDAVFVARTMLGGQFARYDVTQVIVLLTDGKSLSSMLEPLFISMQSMGIRFITLTVGDVNPKALDSISPYSDYLHNGVKSSSPTLAFSQLTELACKPLCSWNQDPCFPGQCGDQGLADHCQCAPGFQISDDADKRCKIQALPNISTCRLILRDPLGNEVMSRTTGSSQHCDDQQHGFMNILPTSLTFEVKAEHRLSLGTFPSYVKKAGVGISGIKLTIVKVTLSGDETIVADTQLNTSPACSTDVNSASPAPHLDCADDVTFTHDFADGERLCVDVTAVAGGFYDLQDPSGARQESSYFPAVSKTRRLCFTYDSTGPTHCSQVPGGSGCSAVAGSPLSLSTRLTRSADIRVVVDDGWMDVGSGVAGYFLEVHEVHAAAGFLSVEEAPIMRKALQNDKVPHDVPVTLPSAATSTEAPRLYAVLLEVHDGAGNVAYARRFVLCDKNSRVVVNPKASLKVITNSNRAEAVRGRGSKGEVCVEWKDRFYNDGFLGFDYLLPVKADTARGIGGGYDQTSGVLPVRGTASVRGVVKFEVSWSVDDGAQSDWQTTSNFPSESACLSLSAPDGVGYRIYVRATDIMNQSATDDVRVILDSTEPDLEELGLKGRQGRTGLHVHDSTDLSTMVVVIEASDPDSGLTSLRWSLRAEGSTDDLASKAFAVQKLRNSTSCGAGKTYCYCPSSAAVGQCEIYRYEIRFDSLVPSHAHVGDHHRHYQLTINAVNGAGLLATRTADILIDTSPPTVGVALEGIGPGGGAEVTGEEVDFTREGAVHVRWHGFRDPESGVVMYRVVLTEKCLSSVQEVEAARNVTEVTATAGSLLYDATLHFPAEGRYFTNVVAYNGALSPSSVACSDGVMYYTSAPRLLDVSIAQGRSNRALACTPATETEAQVTWMLSSALTRTRLPNTTKCFDVCRRWLAASSSLPVIKVDYLPLKEPDRILDEAEAEKLCQSLPVMTEDWWIVLPSDRLLVTWSSLEEEGAIQEFYVGAGSSRTSSADLLPMTGTHRQHVYHNSRTGLGQGAVFFLFLRAVNKAGASTDLVLGPVLVDSTPPTVTTPLTVTALDRDMNDVTVVWTQADIVDPEQPPHIDLKITYRIGHDDGFLTSFTPLNDADIADCQNRDASVHGCLRVPVDELRAHDTTAGRSFFFQLHVQNAAGLTAAFNTSSFRLPPRASHVMVLDILPSMAADWRNSASADVIEDLDVRLEPDVLCAAWTQSEPFDLLGHDVEFGVGHSKESDDVMPFVIADVVQNTACINATSTIPFYKTVYSLIRMTSTSGGSSMFFSDGFTVVPKQDPKITDEVFTGKRCTENEMIHEEVFPTVQKPFTHTVNLPNAASFHAGDVMYVEFHPSVQHAAFPGAHVIHATLSGYQVVLTSHALTVDLPAETVNNNDNISIRIYACEKDVSLWRRKDSVFVSWELKGHQWKFARFLQVRLLEESCLTKRQSTSENTELCTLVESPLLSPGRREMTFDDVTLYAGISYVSSVAVCFDECLPAVLSRPFIVSMDQTMVDIYDANVQLQTTASSAAAQWDVTMEASVEPVLPSEPCYFLWAVARSGDGSRLVDDWKLHKENQCSRAKIADSVSFAGTARGTLYACIQPMYPRRASVPTCRKVTRSKTDEESDVRGHSFHIIELSQNQLHRLNPSDFQLLQHDDGNKLHSLYDLDLDFAEADLVVAAALATVAKGGVSPQVTVTWFLMASHAHVPENGECEADPECVTWHTSAGVNDSSVVFPNYRSRLENQEVYFVCALLSPLDLDNWNGGVADVGEVCGDGFFVDEDPPSPGFVSIHNANDDGILSNSDRVLVTWSGFHDAEMASFGVNVLSYSVALGSYPSGEDIVSFTHVGKRTLWAFDDVNISPGLSCYATVQAQDMAGRVIQVSSEPVLFDDTPPTKGKVVVQGLTSGQRCVSSHQVLVTWYEVMDMESGIARQEVGVAGHAHSERWQAANDVSMVVPFNVILRGNSYTLNHLSAELVDGHSYVMLLKSTNHAGLTTVTSSEAVIADSSPPRIGTVQVDTSQHSNSKRDSLHPAHDVYRARWSGFVDPHCGIAYYRVALGSSPQQDDIVAFHYVGLRTSYTWEWSPDAGGQYFALVEACNHAGLCSIASSHAFLVDPTPPTSGHVIVGANPRHSPYWGHDTFLVARWIGLFDPQSDVREFLWCVGRDPGSCDFTAMTSSMRERAALASGLSLPTTVPLYVTVVAENNAGQRTKRVSNRFFVDVSPPEVLESPTFVSTTTRSPTTGQPDRSTLSLTWSFTDPDSPILTQTISVSGQGQGRHGLANPIVVALVAPDNKLTLQLDRDNLLMDGDVYTASVTACNAAELCTTAVSGPLLVDSTPPIIGRFEPEMKWEVVSGKSVTGSRGFVEDFVTLVHVAWSDFADEESGMSGYHLTVGRSYSGDEVSGSSVFVSHNSSSRTQIFSLNINETFHSGDLLVFSLWAVNNPGLISPVLRTTFEVLLESASGEAGTLVQQRHSCAPYYCTNECTCSARGRMCQPSTETATPCRDLSSNKDFLSSGIDLEPRLGCPSCSLRFITSATCLEGHWTKPSNPDPSVYAISRFQWSFGLAGSPPGVGVFDTADSPSVWHDAGLRTSVTYCLPGHRTLSSGSKYVLHVRAWLSRDSYFVQTSPPVATDHSTPVRRRGRSVRESVDVPACGTRNDVDFFSDGKMAALSACWDGVFSDEQSGIRSYDVWIGTLPFGDDYQRPQNVYLNTSIPIDTSSMIQGVNYYITVRAVNGAGLMSTVTSDGVMKDATPPVSGVVYTSARHTTRHVTDDVTTLHASWDGFYDLHSGLTSFFVSLFDADDVNTPIVDFEPVKLRKAHRFGNLSLIHGHSYKVAVKAVDAAGLVSSTAWSAAILTDVTPPRGATCQSFTLEAETTLVPTSQSSPSSASFFHHERYHATLNAGITSDLARSRLLKVALSATSLRPSARGEVTLDSGDISMPLVLQFHTFSNQSSAEHVLMVGGGQRSVSVAVHGNTGADITARLFSCSRVVLSDKEAVTIRQVSQTALSVCTTIADDESSVTALKIGVGTTPGGLQVQPLTSAVGGHGWLVTDASHVPHGTPLYAVVWARNLGNAWARFVSRDPVLFDLTPPVISGLDVTLTAAYDNGGRGEGGGDAVVVDGGGGGPGEGDAGVLVTAVAVWSAVDEESGGVICTCSLVGHQTSDDVTQLLDDATVGRCQWKLRHLQHGSRVHVVVSCRNQVDIVSTKTSDDVTVLIRPPDLSKVSLRALNNYATFSPYDRAENLFRSSDSDLQFSWTGAHDPTVEQYQYRFTFNSAPLTGWSPLPPYKSAAILTKSEGRRGSVAAQVRALYRKELISEVVSAHVILHDAKPALTGTKATATVTNGRLRLDWAQVFSIDRNATFSVHAGTSEEFGDVINHYVTATSSYEGAFDKELHLLFVNIECVYYNGLLELYHDEIAL